MFLIVGFRPEVLTILNVLPRSICQFQHNYDHLCQNGDRSLSPSARDRILNLQHLFVELHWHTFYTAAVACIAMQGGPKTFDFRGNVMLVGLHYRNQNRDFVSDPNPGTAFSFLYAEAVPINELFEEVPALKKVMQLSGDKSNAVGELDKKTMGDFVGVLRILYWADGLVVFSDVGITADNVTGCEGWQSRLKLAVDNGVVRRMVGNTEQEGKIVKQGSRWKWVSI
jgi:hypothetical protein